MHKYFFVSRSRRSRRECEERLLQEVYSHALKRFISRVRQRVEGVFHEIQNTGRNPERLLNKTVDGFCVHIAAKIASHTLRLLLRHHFGINVLTFESQPI